MTEAKHLVLPTLMHRLHDSSQMSACVLGGGERFTAHMHILTCKRDKLLCHWPTLTVTQDMISFRFVF